MREEMMEEFGAVMIKKKHQAIDVGWLDKNRRYLNQTASEPLNSGMTRIFKVPQLWGI
jgi:hypothetical protein